MEPISVMIVENNTDFRNSLRHAFEVHGYLTWTCPAPGIAVSIFAAVQPSVVLLDLDFEGIDPMRLIAAWRELAPSTRVIVESTIADAGQMREAMERGAYAYLVKPYSPAPLFDLLEKEVPPCPSSTEGVRTKAA